MSKIYIVTIEDEIQKGFSSIFQARLYAFREYIKALNDEKTTGLEGEIEVMLEGYHIENYSVAEWLEEELGEFDIRIEEVEVE